MDKEIGRLKIDNNLYIVKIYDYNPEDFKFTSKLYGLDVSISRRSSKSRKLASKEFNKYSIVSKTFNIKVIDEILNLILTYWKKHKLEYICFSAFYDHHTMFHKRLEFYRRTLERNGFTFIQKSHHNHYIMKKPKE